MAKRLVKKGVTVVRDGRRVRPEVGKLFDFSKEEIDGLNEADATALGKASEADSEDGTATTASTSNAETSQSKASGGKKAATANKADGESDGKSGTTDDDL